MLTVYTVLYREETEAEDFSNLPTHTVINVQRDSNPGSSRRPCADPSCSSRSCVAVEGELIHAPVPTFRGKTPREGFVEDP